MPLVAVREQLTELSASGPVVMRALTDCEGARTIDAWQYPLSAFVPA